jgi:predicted RNase H-like HicB family nuclease
MVLEQPKLQDSTAENGEIWIVPRSAFYYWYATTNSGAITQAGTVASYPQQIPTGNSPNLSQVTATYTLLGGQTAGFPFSFTNMPEWFRTLTPQFVLDPQEEGGFVAYSNEYPGAIGQGETEEEALSDLQQAIDLLKEVLEQDKKQQ